MAKFVYKAKKGLDDTFEGVIEAQNDEDALNKLVAQGLFPINIQGQLDIKVEEAVVVKKPKPLRGKKITSAEIYSFTQKLTTLIRAKVELLSSLRILYEQAENPVFRGIIVEIYNSTKEGNPFSESLVRYPKIFPILYVNIVRAGEATGMLDVALEQISEFLAREEGLRNKVKVALAYPTLLILVGMASIFILITFVVPKLRPILEGMGDKLPLITKVILAISSVSNKYWWGVLAIAVVGALILYQRSSGLLFKRLGRKAMTVLPVLKRLTKNQELSYFSRALALLLKSGVPALKSLEISISNIEDQKLKTELESVCKNVASGHSLAKSMSTLTGLPKFFTKMVAVGEESGRLSEVLAEAAVSYIQQVESDIALVTSLLEPILILILGLVLGTIVLSILLPTFQITQFVR
ncbi:MAG: type II secretion system F family protein [Candidatus Omnitrophica bacterium]|nr:type II secretion system F family protein [Candidatus Omnitrophota bacterium]